MVMTDERRRKWIEMGIRVQVLSVLWTLLEAVLGAVAASAAGSLAISAFSVDSAIELLSGFVLFVRLIIEYQSGENGMSKVVERIASGIVAVSLFTLAIFISWKSGEAFALRVPASASALGIVVAAIAAVVSPMLAVAKRRIGERIHSHALLGDAACSMTCAYMAWVLLAALILQWAFGLWWVDALGAVGILYFVLHEAWESLDAAITGEPHVHGHGGHSHG